MSKNTKRTLLGFVLAIAALVLIAYLPAETEQMSRAAWQYLGCFVFMLVLIISRAVPDWAAVLCTMAVLVALKVATVAEVTSNFASSTVWLCIGVFIMSIGINNIGFMKRLALWVLTRFPGTYAGQVTAMLLSGVIMSPIIPSSTAKTSMMAPFVNQVCEASGAERNSKQSLGLWFANFMGTNQLGMAFVSGSVYVALMLGFVGESVSWGQWFVRACVWYVVCIILVYVFCLIFCKPTETQKAANVEFIKESYKALGKISTKEKQGIIIVLAALVLWLTQSTHKIDAGMIAILADVAFIACGLITPPEVGAKGMWTITIFVGGVLSVAGLMASLGVSTWLAGILGPILAPIMSSPWIFIPALCIITYLLRFVIVSQSCCMAVMIAIFGSLLEAHGINIFVLVFTSWVSGTCWNVAYQNPASAGLIKMCDPSLDFATASKGSYAYCIINLIAMTCSVPLWMALGLL